MTKRFKKINVLTLLALALAFIFASIGISFSAKKVSAEEYPSYSKTVYEDNMARPFWKSNIIFNEACSPISRWDDQYEYGYGTMCALTKFKPVKVLSVMDHTLKITYTEGVDYIVDAENHKLTFPAGGALANKGLDSRTAVGNNDTQGYVDQVNQAYGSNVTRDPGSNTTWDPQGGNPYTSTYTIMAGVTYNEVMLFPQTYLYVTYVYEQEDVPTGLFTEYDANALTTFQSALAGEKSEIKVLSIGDSISAGCNATGGIPGMTWPWGEPYQPPYQQLFVDELADIYNKNVTIKYASLGGTTSAWPLGSSATGGEVGVNGTYGGDVIGAALAEADYDLAIIAYGMNDAGMARGGTSFQNNISAICQMVLADNPNCDIILMNSFPRNPVASANLGSNIENLLRNDYLTALNNVASSLGTAKCRVLNMHAIGDFYMGRGNYTSEIYNKKYFEISASNMNHINDSFHRMYAMQLTAATVNYKNAAYQEFFGMAYDVTFDSNGGTAVDSQAVIFGEKATAPTEAPTRAGFDFAGWYLNGEAYDFDAVLSSDITLVAKWTLADGSSSSDTKWTVTFNYNDQTTANSTAQVADGEAVAKPDDPVRENYEFLGWYLENGDQYDFIKNISSDVTLTAKWKATSTEVKDMFTVTFDTTGGSTINPVTVYEGDKVTKPTDPTKAKHKFLGWTLDGNPYNFTAGVTGDITLVANWEMIFSLTDYVAVQELDASKTEIVPTAPQHYNAWQAALINFNYRISDVDTYMSANGMDFINLDNNAVLTFTSATGENKLQGVSFRENYLFVWPINANDFVAGDIITIEKGLTWGNYQVKQRLSYTCQGKDQLFTLNVELEYVDINVSAIYLYNDTAWGAPTIELELGLPAGTVIGQYTDFRSTMNMEYVKASGGNGNLADCTFTANNRFLVRLADDLNATNKYFAVNGDKFTIKAGSYITVGLKGYRIANDVTYIVTNDQATSTNGGQGFELYTGEPIVPVEKTAIEIVNVNYDPDTMPAAGYGNKVLVQVNFDTNAVMGNYWLALPNASEYVEITTATGTVVPYLVESCGTCISINRMADVNGHYLISVGDVITFKAGWVIGDYEFKEDVSYKYVTEGEPFVLVGEEPDPTPVTYTVTFDANGGTFTGEVEVTVEENTAVAQPVAPTKEATAEFTYEFAGWTLNGEDYDFNTLVTGDITLVAKWTATKNEYTVTFDSNGGTAVDSETVEYGLTFAQPVAPTKDADAEFTYEFAGWTLNGEAYDFETLVTGDITLVAKWTATPIPVEPPVTPDPVPETLTATYTGTITAGEKINPAGISIELTYDDDSTEPVRADAVEYWYSGEQIVDPINYVFGEELIGTVNITVKYEGLETIMAVEVVAPVIPDPVPETLTAIYTGTITVGEKINPAGISIVLTYDDDSTEPVNAGIVEYWYNGEQIVDPINYVFGEELIGTVNITVKYEGLETIMTVEVVAPTEPEDPVDPPVDPEDPTDPEDPVDPPVDPEDPTDPEDPVDPPVDPEDPTDPEDPVDPPVDPEDPTEPEDPDNVAVTDVALNVSSVELVVGGTYQLTATITPNNATNTNVIWISNDTSIATVDANGNVTAVSAGTTVIFVETVDGGLRAGCAITVTTDTTPENPENPETPDAPQGGCGSAIGSVFIPSMVALIGAGIVVAKKKRK
ncbi:MAG: hypothetical protein E7362_03150 [Clostridiales bacterium]|nr:hypothetical protein [Clostridiales bacterium]